MGNGQAAFRAPPENNDHEFQVRPLNPGAGVEQVKRWGVLLPSDCKGTKREQRRRGWVQENDHRAVEI